MYKYIEITSDKIISFQFLISSFHTSKKRKSFHVQMTSCSSLTCKYDDNMDDIHLESQKVQSKQERRCLGSQTVPNDLSTNGSMNIVMKF